MDHRQSKLCVTGAIVLYVNREIFLHGHSYVYLRFHVEWMGQLQYCCLKKKSPLPLLINDTGAERTSGGAHENSYSF